MTTYIIHDHTEETDCDYCGQPLYTGDKAVEDVRGMVFCSKTCSVISISRVTVLTSEREYDANRANRWDNQNKSRYFDEIGDTY